MAAGGADGVKRARPQRRGPLRGVRRVRRQGVDRHRARRPRRGRRVEGPRDELRRPRLAVPREEGEALALRGTFRANVGRAADRLSPSTPLRRRAPMTAPVVPRRHCIGRLTVTGPARDALRARGHAARGHDAVIRLPTSRPHVTTASVTSCGRTPPIRDMGRTERQILSFRAVEKSEAAEAGPLRCVSRHGTRSSRRRGSPNGSSRRARYSARASATARSIPEWCVSSSQASMTSSYPCTYQ